MFLKILCTPYGSKVAFPIIEWSRRARRAIGNATFEPYGVQSIFKWIELTKRGPKPWVVRPCYVTFVYETAETSGAVIGGATLFEHRGAPGLALGPTASHPPHH